MHSKIEHNRHAMAVLEFPKIIEAISHYCTTETARKEVQLLNLIKDIDLINLRQEIISEIRQLLGISNEPNLSGLGDPQLFLDKAQKEGVLSEYELWEISKLSRINSHVLRIAISKIRFPRLRDLLEGLMETSSVHHNIERFIEAPGVFKEDASERLVQLRMLRKVAHDKLQDKLESLLVDDKYIDYWQENLITLRNERFVLPLKAERKTHMPGVIHDRSATGATLFIEPLEIVPLNNQLRELQLEEHQERNRILRKLSEIVAAYAHQLYTNLKILHHLDFLTAIACFGDSISGNTPTVAEDVPLTLIDARHPILLIERGLKNVVPLDMEMTPRTKCILITGPNMGGKTVALKTVGLISFMAISGLPVPADSKTKIPFFKKFFADIGDEQSVEESISSFTSHLVHYKDAAEKADSSSLVLFDELGGATDPQEGMPLSWALVESLVEQGSILISNTHLGGLIGLSVKSDKVTNAGMEFDEHNMKPTYRMILGVPGKCWAIETARSIDLPEEILKKAEEFSGGGTALDKVLSELQRKIRIAEDQKRTLGEELADIKAKRQILEGLMISNQQKERELDRLRRAYDDQRETRIAAAIEREIEKIRNDWEKIISEQPERQRDKGKVDEFISNLKARLKRAEKARDKRRGMSKELEPGQRVFIYRLRKWGDVSEPTDEQGFVKIVVGNMTLRVHSSSVDTEHEYDKKRAKRRKQTGGIKYKPRKVPPKFDIRGCTPEEAWVRIDRLLDDAVSSETNEILIIHGKGTGTLRRFIRDKFHLDKRISELKLPTQRMGGDGATIAVIALDIDGNVEKKNTKTPESFAQ